MFDRVFTCPSIMLILPQVLYVAMTRENSVWRCPLNKDGTTTKAGRFCEYLSDKLFPQLVGFISHSLQTSRLTYQSPRSVSQVRMV